MVWAHSSCDISYGLRTSNKRYRPTTCNNSIHTSIVVHEHRLDDSSYVLHASTWKYCSMEKSIIWGMHASNVACAHLLGDIGRGLHVLARRRRPTTCCINQGLSTSDMVSAHIERNIRQRHHHPRIFIHNPWRVWIVLMTTISKIWGTINGGLCT